MGRKDYDGYGRPDRGYGSDPYGLDKSDRDQLFGLFDEQYEAFKKRIGEEIISYKDMYEGAKTKANALESRVNVRDVMEALLPIITSIYNEVMDNGDLEDMRRTVQRQISRLAKQLSRAGVEIKYHERGDRYRSGDKINPIPVPTWDRGADSTVKSCYTMGCVIRGEEHNPIIEEAEIYSYDPSMRRPVEEMPETAAPVTAQDPYEVETVAPVTDETPAEAPVKPEPEEKEAAPVTAEKPCEPETAAPVTVQNPYEAETVAPVTDETPAKEAPAEDMDADYDAYRVNEEPVKEKPVAVNPEHTMKLKETATPEPETEKKPTHDLEIGATYMRFLKPIYLRSELGKKIQIVKAGAMFNREKPLLGGEKYTFDIPLHSWDIPRDYYTLYIGDKPCSEKLAIGNGSLSYLLKVSGKTGIIFNMYVNRDEVCSYSMSYTVAKNTEGGN